MLNDDELIERLRKALNSSRHALDSTQLEVAIGGVARMLANNLQVFNRIFAPFISVTKPDPRVAILTKENFDLRIQIEELKFRLQQRQAPRERVVVVERPSGQSRRQWSADEYRQAVRSFIDGATWPDVARTLALSPGEVKGMFINRAPREDLLGEKIIVQSEGPMTIKELWKIGHALFGEGWRAKIETRYDLPEETILWNTPVEALTPNQIQELRAEWPRTKKARAEADDQAYRAFERIARTYDPSMGPISWQKVLIQMRDQGVGVTTTLVPSFAARYDAENGVTLFKVTERTRQMAADEADIPDLLPLTQELQAHLADLRPPPMRSHMPVYIGILRAGPSGISIRRLDLIGWGQQVGMTLHQMGRAPIDLERQKLIRKTDESEFIATYWHRND